MASVAPLALALNVFLIVALIIWVIRAFMR
jgi:hypothetical protein